MISLQKNVAKGIAIAGSYLLGYVPHILNYRQRKVQFMRHYWDDFVTSQLL